MFKFSKLFTISLLGFLLLLLVATTPKTEAARTDDVWQERLGSYLETAWNEGRNILINGANKYLNFGTFSGSSGYGIRDNAGTIECKNDGGSWGPCQDGTGGGGSGGGGLATTTPWTNGNLAYVTGLGTVGSVATGTLTETVTGLQFDQTRGLVGGAAILSLTSGYDIPLSASTTQWSGFYNTPSTRITAGSRLSWSGNTLSAALQISTSSSNGALAFWTGTSALGSVATGTLTETVTGLELSATRGLVGGAAVLALTSGYSIPLTASSTEWTNFYNTPSTRITAGTNLSWSGNTLNASASGGSSNWTLMSGGLRTSTSTDFARAAYFVATSTTATSTFPHISISSTLDLFGNFYTSLANFGTGVVQAITSVAPTGTWNFNGATVKQHTYKSFTWPGTATTTSATTTIPLGTAFTTEAWNSAECWVTNSTGSVIFTDGTNRMNGFTATTTAARTTLSANNTFTVSERRYAEVGILTAAQLSCSLDVTVNN